MIIHSGTFMKMMTGENNQDNRENVAFPVKRQQPLLQRTVKKKSAGCYTFTTILVTDFFYSAASYGTFLIKLHMMKVMKI